MIFTQSVLSISRIKVAEELFEIAGLYYRRKRDEGRLRLNLIMHMLSEEEKSAFLSAKSTDERVRILLRAAQRLASGLSEEINPEEVFGNPEGKKGELISFSSVMA